MKKSEIVESIMKQFEQDYFNQYGYIMDSHTKKVARKKAEKLAERKMKTINNMMFI